MSLITDMAFWGANAWPTTVPAYGDPPRDVNGVLITLGATVKFVGVVTAINNDLHFGNIAVTGIHPNGRTVVFSVGQGLSRSANYAIPNPQDAVGKRGFQPVELVVGS